MRGFCRFSGMIRYSSYIFFSLISILYLISLGTLIIALSTDSLSEYGIPAKYQILIYIILLCLFVLLAYTYYKGIRNLLTQKSTIVLSRYLLFLAFSILITLLFSKTLNALSSNTAILLNLASVLGTSFVTAFFGHTIFPLLKDKDKYWPFALSIGMVLLMNLGNSETQSSSSTQYNNVQTNIIKDDYYEPTNPNVINPKPISQIPPRYPRKAKAKGIEGYVVCKFIVNEFGVTEDIEIIEYSDELFIQPTIEAINHWTFESGKIDGLVSPMSLRVKIPYSLD